MAGLRSQCRVLQIQQLAAHGEINAEWPSPGNRRLADDCAQLGPPSQVVVEPLLGVGNNMQRADAGASYGFERPAVNSDVVRVAGLTVRRKGQDRVRTHITDDFCDALYCCIGICGGATAIGIAEPMVLGHAEDP